MLHQTAAQRGGRTCAGPAREHRGKQGDACRRSTASGIHAPSRASNRRGRRRSWWAVLRATRTACLSAGAGGGGAGGGGGDAGLVVELPRERRARRAGRGTATRSRCGRADDAGGEGSTSWRTTAAVLYSTMLRLRAGQAAARRSHQRPTCRKLRTQSHGLGLGPPPWPASLACLPLSESGSLARSLSLCTLAELQVQRGAGLTRTELPEPQSRSSSQDDPRPLARSTGRDAAAQPAHSLQRAMRRPEERKVDGARRRDEEGREERAGGGPRAREREGKPAKDEWRDEGRAREE